MVHHLATCCLYIGFIVGNLFAVGTVIAFFHDIADIFVSMSRAAHCTGLISIGIGAYFTTLILWIYTRAIILPMYIYNIHIHFVHPEPSLQPLPMIENIFLCVILFLHLFWLVQLLKMAVKITQGIYKDELNNLDTAEDGKKAKTA